MNELLQLIKARWSDLDASDRKAIKTGGVTLSLLMFIGLIVVPSYHAYTSLRSDVPKLKAQLEVMKAQAHEVKRLRANPSAQRGNESLLTVLEKSTALHDIKPMVQSLTPRPDQTAAIRLKAIEYAKLLKWLAGLSSQYRLKATEVELSHTDTHASGTVDAFVVFRDTAANR